MNTASATDGNLQQRVDELDWYHTIDLGNGIVSPGMFDTRATVGKVPLPASLEGKRCLDVGTWDGFWAFEMERRGAASVTAIDIKDQTQWDWPPYMRVSGKLEKSLEYTEQFREEGAAFRLAHDTLQSSVEHRSINVYDLNPDEIGTFDFVFLGSLLLHLRDPIKALDSLRSVCSGEAVIADTIDAVPSFTRRRTPTARLEGIDRPWWWIPNRMGLFQMVQSAGFEMLETTPVYILPIGKAHPRHPLWKLWRSPFSAKGREEMIIRLRGIPHAAVRARPIG